MGLAADNGDAVIRFQERLSDSPLIERVWRCHSERGGRFVSVAASNFELALTCLAGKTFLTIRGPETRATIVECPAHGEWLGIRFRPGTFMPALLPGSLLDHADVELPGASSRSFWLSGSVWQYPNFENAETFVCRLVKAGILVRDPLVADILKQQPAVLSLRTAQRRFLRATGLNYATFRQIERARHATVLLTEGFSIADAVHAAGYFDQAHLTRSFSRFIGQTPGRVSRLERQLSFLYKTAQARSPYILCEAGASTAPHTEELIYGSTGDSLRDHGRQRR